MSQSYAGEWVQLDADKLVLATSEAGLQVLPSQYDVPVAIRINEGEPNEPSYAVEVRYVGGTDERTQRQRLTDDIDAEIGKVSGRVYRLLVSSHRVGAREQLGAVVEAIGTLSATKNVNMVCRAVKLHEAELLSQLQAGDAARLAAAKVLVSERNALPHWTSQRSR